MREFLLLTLLATTACLQAQPAGRHYPDFNTSYSDADLQAYIRYYTAHHDSIGLAYTYANGVKRMGPDYEIELGKYKNLLRYIAVLKGYSEKDYYQFLHLLVRHFYFSQDKYSLKRSIAICDSVINYAKRSLNPQLEFEAYMSKIFLLKKNDKSIALFNEYRKEVDRLSQKHIHKKTLYFVISGEWFMQYGLYDKAETCFTRCYAQSFTEHTFVNRVVSLLFLGKLFRIQKRDSQAFVYVRTANQVLNQNPEVDLQRWMHEEYALLYTASGDYKKAAHHWSIYDKKIKQLNAIKSELGDFNGLRMEFIERELKLENENFKLYQRMARETDRRKTIQLVAFTAIFLLLVLLILVLFFYYRQQIKDFTNQRKIAVLEGQELEREEIARELHDHVGSMLAGIKVHIPTSASNYLQLMGWVDDVYYAIRTLSHNLHTGVLHEEGLPQACSDFIALIDPEHKITLQVHGSAPPIPPFTNTMAFRTIQELLTNALRHANAQAIQLVLLFADSKLLISVEDDGMGFDTTASYTGIGLRSVKSRVETLRGQLEFVKAEKAGITVLITLPLKVLV